MSKEIELSKTLEIQDNLWGKLCGRDGLWKRRDQARKGHLPAALSLPELRGNFERFANILGDFAPRVLMISNPNNPGMLVPEQIAVAGGWCALRTADVNNISQQGAMMDPETGRLEQIKSVGQVASWIERSGTFDQIIESIGVLSACEYAVISERRLWATRIVTKLSQILDRNLSTKEINTIESSIEKAELIRAEMTKRYLQFATGRESLVFRRVVDDDIWDELRKAQIEMFAQTGLSLEQLKLMFPNDALTIDSSALVWTMYSQPYFDILREQGVISRETAFVVEPSLHTYADTQAGDEVVKTIYHRKGFYFDSNGMNKDTGFIAFIECVTPGGVSVRKNLQVGEVPNISNWRKLFKENGMLDPEKNAIINPTDNLIFVWGVNLLPFGSTRQALLRLVSIQQEFLEEKAKITADFPASVQKKDARVRENVQGKVEELRFEFQKRVQEQNEVITSNLKQLFDFLTRGLL